MITYILNIYHALPILIGGAAVMAIIVILWDVQFGILRKDSSSFIIKDKRKRKIYKGGCI
jgi:hypothetical protein